MSLKIGIIGKAGTTARVDIEPDYKRVINRILTFALCEHIDIDVVGFKNEMRKKLNTEDISTEDILIAFDNMETNEQLDIIRRCGIKRPNIEVDSPLLLPLDMYSFEQYDYDLKSSGKYDNLGDSQLKRMIKYSNNPMEKKQLQRELSSRNFMCGKHTKGKRRKTL